MFLGRKIRWAVERLLLLPEELWYDHLVPPSRSWKSSFAFYISYQLVERFAGPPIAPWVTSTVTVHNHTTATGPPFPPLM